jgi:DMSO/TMAO reductase YedYZ molybdopterin-dependent catalytic subunit/thiosulfate reductase cytochrome b subunit
VDRFPPWVIVTHFLNIVFMLMMARSGVEILSAFPKLYWIRSCLPGREWLRFSSKTFCADSARLWSSLDEEESWSPLVAMPGRKNLGLGRHWHFATVPFWIANGAVYVAMLFASGYWRTLVPTHWSLFPQAVHDVGTYLQFHFPPLVPGSRFNAVQQLSYFAVVFLLAPLQIATGAAMSPAVVGRFPRYVKLFGGRQAARSLHFVGMVAFGVFVVVHVAMVVIHGLGHEFAAMMLGSYGADARLALVLGLSGLAAVLLLNAVLTWLSLRHKRTTQRLLGMAVDPMERALGAALTSRQHYRPADISSFHRVNGYPPPDPSYQAMAGDGFAGFRLEVGGLVEHPQSFNLPQLRELGWQTQITLHNCIQGWTAVAEWGGVPMAAVLAAVTPCAQARYVVFHAFDDKALTEDDGRSGFFYGTLPLVIARRPQTILALEMNGEPLPVRHGAPVRLRVEDQLGFKMVKWVRRIELVDDYRRIGQGQGGWREDQQYYTTYAAF